MLISSCICSHSFLFFYINHMCNIVTTQLFCNRMFGQCVDELSIMWRPRQIENSFIFGKVVFHFSAIPVIILGKENQVVFDVNFKSLWCLRFDPLNKNNEEQRCHVITLIIYRLCLYFYPNKIFDVVASFGFCAFRQE